ncbi:MAG: arylsulfatase [Alphaproteobacteria bacterium]|nr:arylsulfatase [Alphaproteobacteria bacterium]
MTARVFVVSPMDIAMQIVADAFEVIWPEAKVINLLDESLYADFAGGKPQTEETGERLSKLLHYAADAGADGMIFAGSVFGRWVEAARTDIDVPCLTSYEAMIEEAFECGDRFGILVTAPGTLKCLVEDIDRYSKANGLSCTITDRIEDAARPVILSGDIETHDRMVADAAAKMTDCDCLMLGQFSMGRAAKKIADVPGRPVLTAPEAGVRKLKRLLG